MPKNNINQTSFRFKQYIPLVLFFAEVFFLFCAALLDKHIVVKIFFLFLAVLRMVIEKNHSNYANETNVLYLTVMYIYFVYSTFTGMNNWLGTAFYEFFRNSVFPFAILLILIDLAYIVSVWMLVKKYVKLKELSLTIVASLVVSLLIWYPVSFESYYSAVELKNKEVSKLMLDNTKLILKSDKSEEEKNSALNNTFYKIIWARLYKNGSIYYTTTFTRPNIDEAARKEKFDTVEKFSIGDDEYLYRDIWLNRPGMVSGVAKAVSWSLLPYTSADPGDNNTYIKSQRAGRSMNLWIIFSALFGLVCASLYVFNEKKAQLKMKEAELHNQYKNTGLIQEIIFKQLTREMNDVVASVVKARLQKAISEDEDDKDKAVYSSDGFNATMTSIEESISSKIHDFKNNWIPKDDSGESLTKSAKERTLVDKILEDLESLKVVFDVSYSDFKASEVEEIIRSAIPGQYKKAPVSEFAYSCLLRDEKIKDKLVMVNKYRIGNIVKNLLQNSNVAINKYKYKLPTEARKKFKRFMSLTLDTEIREGKEYFTICVEDNGGGFAEKDINNIYKNPIESSDLTRGERMGEGTLYVGMFVARMDGFIEASNKKMSDGNIGACTKILLPLKEEKRNG